MARPFDPNANLPATPARLVDRLRSYDFVIKSVDAAGGGVMGAKKLGLVFPKDGLEIDVKWKAAPPGGEGWNNSPRREIGAYAVQELFLDPDDYPVPPVVARGIPLDAYAVVDEAATPNIEGTRCVFGGMAAWLENVAQPENAFDPERFSADRRYAFHFANLNLLAYLIAHRDARSNNFLMPKDPSNPRVFSIDNGIAFGGVFYNFVTWHFDEIRTAGLPKPSIDRLRRVSRETLSGLGVLGELHADSAGVLSAVTPGENLDPKVGTRVAPGRIQLGLTTAEIDGIATRLQELLARIDAGELGVF
ncbi:MAG: hypothetical protein ACHQ3O_00325 [Candidatus Limnocylindria bacterium]|jgi:hypothetical protein